MLGSARDIVLVLKALTGSQTFLASTEWGRGRFSVVCMDSNDNNTVCVLHIHNCKPTFVHPEPRLLRVEENTVTYSCKLCNNRSA